MWEYKAEFVSLESLQVMKELLQETTSSFKDPL